MAYVLYQKLCPAGLKNNPNSLLKSISFVTIHCTGNYSISATAKSHADYQYGGSGGRSASWHYTVDDREVWQSFEDERRCWHAGDAVGNSTSIGIEICVNNRPGFADACDNAARLTAELLRRHGLSLGCVVQHNKWSGKNCPDELRSGAWGVTWDGFISMVRKYYAGLGDDEVVGEMKLTVNGGREIVIPSVLKDDRNYPQLQALAAAVGFKADYDAARNLVMITK